MLTPTRTIGLDRPIGGSRRAEITAGICRAKTHRCPSQGRERSHRQGIRQPTRIVRMAQRRHLAICVKRPRRSPVRLPVRALRSSAAISASPGSRCSTGLPSGWAGAFPDFVSPRTNPLFVPTSPSSVSLRAHCDAPRSAILSASLSQRSANGDKRCSFFRRHRGRFLGTLCGASGRGPSGID